jgi:multidrug efflux pump subunit AcrB
MIIDPRPFETTLRQAQANVARDTAQLHQTEAALVQREAEVRQAQANLDRDQAQLENARTQEQRFLPAGMAYEWSGLAFQEIEAGSRAGFVFACPRCSSSWSWPRSTRAGWSPSR